MAAFDTYFSTRAVIKCRFRKRRGGASGLRGRVAQRGKSFSGKRDAGGEETAATQRRTCCRHQERPLVRREADCESDRSEVAELRCCCCCRAGLLQDSRLRFPDSFFLLLTKAAAALKSVKRVLNHLSNTRFYWISSFSF